MIAAWLALAVIAGAGFGVYARGRAQAVPDYQLAKIRDDGALYILHTPCAQGSDELRDLMHTVNRELERLQLDHVTVLVLPGGARLEDLDSRDLHRVGLYKRSEA